MRPIWEGSPVAAPYEGDVLLLRGGLHGGSQLASQRPIPAHLATAGHAIAIIQPIGHIDGVAGDVSAVHGAGRASLNQRRLALLAPQALHNNEGHREASLFNLERRAKPKAHYGNRSTVRIVARVGDELQVGGHVEPWCQPGVIIDLGCDLRLVV